MPKLYTRLLMVMTGLSIGAVLLLGLSVYLVVQSALRRNLDDSLIQLARTELASATDLGYVHVHEFDPQTLTVTGAPGYEKFVWIVDDRDKIVARTSNIGIATRFAGTRFFKDAARKGHTVLGDILVNGQVVRAVFYPFRDPELQPLVGIVGVPENVVTDVVASVGRVILFVGLFCIALTFGVVMALSRSLSDPISTLTREAEKIDLAHPEMAQTLHAPYIEINGLASAINSLVKRVVTVLNERDRIIRSQRQLIADASHELRTPVSNIQGTIEVTLRNDRTVKEYQEHLRTALMETERMGRLINDLLSLAKSDLGHFRIEPVPMDLVPVVRQSVQLLAQGRGDGIDLATSLPAELLANADPDRIRQAVDNLLLNALTHASQRVKVRMSQEEGLAILEVANDGPDLAPGDADRIFDRFFRSDQSRSRDTGGSGLGLAVVRAIAEGHGGHASASSQDGWTAFKFVIPSDR